MNIIKKTLTITACALVMTAGQTALAESADESAMAPAAEVLDGPAIGLVRTPISVEFTRVAVSYADLTLDSTEGVQGAYRLLQRAAKEVCSGAAERHGRSVIMKSSRLRCYREALSSAVENIDNENLTRFHAG